MRKLYMFSLLLIPVAIAANCPNKNNQSNQAIAQSTNNHLISATQGVGTLEVRNSSNENTRLLKKDSSVNEIQGSHLNDGDVIIISGDLRVTISCLNGKQWHVSPGVFHGVINGCSESSRNPLKLR